MHAFLGLRRRTLNIVFYSIGVAFSGANLFSTSFIAHTHVMFGSVNYLSPTLLYNAFVVFFFASILYSHLLLFHEYRIVQSDERRQRIAYFFAASFIGFTGGSMSFLPVYGVDIFPFPGTIPRFFGITPEQR